MGSVAPAVVILGALAAPALATPPPQYEKSDAWHDAVTAARVDLEACNQLGVAAGVFGDVDVRLKRRRWTSSASRSLGRHAHQIETCVRTAIQKQMAGKTGFDDSRKEELGHVLRIGTPVVLLPPATTLMPVWRRVVAKDARARAEIVKLLPPDYTLAKDGCFKTARSAVEAAEYLWLPSVGLLVPRMWEKLIPKATGVAGHLAMWDPAGGFIVKGPRGLCLVPFDATRQATLHTEMLAQGTCWAGGFADILLQPHVEFPTDKKYTSVSTQLGRACAVTIAGEVVCCGPIDPPLPRAPSPVKSIALGHGFACGLDAQGKAICWGNIVAPPAGAFTKLSASYEEVCGVRSSGELACWGSGVIGAVPIARQPAGKFIDVASSTHSPCALRADGTVACWGAESRELAPPGAFAKISATWTHGCGVRRDGRIGCWMYEGAPVLTLMRDRFKEVVAGDAMRFCGLRSDDTVACATFHPNPPAAMRRPPPTAKLATLAGDHDLFCGVRLDAGVECFGDPWPGDWLADNKWIWPVMAGLTRQPVPASTLTLAGRVVDDLGRPIANAEVLACSDYGPCGSVVREATRSPGTVAQLVAAMKPHWEPDTFAIAKTGADGRWSGTFKVNLHRLDRHYEIRAVITGPQREVAELTVHPMSAVERLGRDIALQPASSLDVEPMCGTARCSGKVLTSVTRHQHHEGTHVERLVPGTYTIDVRVNERAPGEHIGEAIVDVTHAVTAHRVKLAMRPAGTGKSIRGTAKLDGVSRDNVNVMARCTGGGAMVVRDAVTNSAGEFEIRDAGAPPCEVLLPNAGRFSSGTPSVTVDKLPAAGISLEGLAIRAPHGF